MSSSHNSENIVRISKTKYSKKMCEILCQVSAHGPLLIGSEDEINHSFLSSWSRMDPILLAPYHLEILNVYLKESFDAAKLC